MRGINLVHLVERKDFHCRMELARTYGKTTAGAVAAVIGSVAIPITLYVLRENVPLAVLGALGDYYLVKVGIDLIREAREDREGLKIIADLENRLATLETINHRVIDVPPEDYIVS